MKKIIVTGLSLMLGIVVFSSFESNVTTFAGDCTGATGGTGTCSSSGCHYSSASSDLNLSIVVTNASDGQPAGSSYIPNNNYVITIKGTHSGGGGGSYSAYGLQFATGKLDDGQFTLINNQLKQVIVAPYEYIEHRNPLAPLPPGGVHYETYFFWKAPPPGAGNITFYCTMLAGNGDHTANGDIERNTSIIFTEAPVNSVKDLAGISATVYPNPATSEILLRTDVKEYGNYAVSIYNLSGQRISHEVVSIQSPAFSKQFATGHFSTGMYLMELRKGDRSLRIPFIKQ